MRKKECVNAYTYNIITVRIYMLGDVFIEMIQRRRGGGRRRRRRFISYAMCGARPPLHLSESTTHPMTLPHTLPPPLTTTEHSPEEKANHILRSALLVSNGL